MQARTIQPKTLGNKVVSFHLLGKKSQEFTQERYDELKPAVTLPTQHYQSAIPLSPMKSSGSVAHCYRQTVQPADLAVGTVTTQQKAVPVKIVPVPRLTQINECKTRREERVIRLPIPPTKIENNPILFPPIKTVHLPQIVREMPTSDIFNDLLLSDVVLSKEDDEEYNKETQRTL